MRYVIYFQDSDNIELQAINSNHDELDSNLLLIKYPPKILAKDYIKSVEIVEYDTDDVVLYEKENRNFTSVEVPLFIQYGSSAELEWYVSVPKGKDLKDAILHMASKKNVQLLATGQHYIKIEAFDFYGAGGEGLAPRGRF